MPEKTDTEGLDVAGFGKIAKAIPPEVYEKSATTVLKTFRDLVAPITETTSGLGRYLHQKFDNMVEVEKALGTFTLEKAMRRAREKAERNGSSVHPPTHPKSFVKAIEEASKETDPLLHEMWANLLASQLTEETCHPHFIQTLSHFSPSEAKLLTCLLPRNQLRGHTHPNPSFLDTVTQWSRDYRGEPQPWSLSCALLRDLGLAAVTRSLFPPTDIILYRTDAGDAFLAAVSPPPPAPPA